MKKQDFWYNYLKIEDFFNHNEQKQKFTDFCSENSAIYLSDITEDILEKYSFVPGIGPRRINDIKKELNKISNRIENQLNFSEILNCPLDKIIFNIKNIQNLTIGEFLTLSEEELKVKGFKRKELEKLFLTSLITLPLKETLTVVQSILSEEDLSLLIDRLQKGKTLEEIGHSRNISRERTRQIEIKLKQNISYILKSYNFNVALKIAADFKDEISSDEMYKLFGSNNSFLVNLLMKNEIFSRPFYIDFLDLFLFDKRERFFKIFYSLEFSTILTTANVNTIRTNFKSFSWITQEEIEKIITKLGYEKHGKYYAQNSGYKDILELYFVKLVKKPLRVDENSIRDIILDLNASLEYNLYVDEINKPEDNNANINLARRLEGLLSRVDGIIMTDSRTYIHISKIEYDKEAFIALKDKILSFNSSYIDSIAVYRHLEKELNSIGIFSEHVFYSLFKYHFSQELNLSTNGNSRVLTVGEQEFNRVEELEKFIASNNKVLEKSYIQEKLNYSNVSLNNAIDNSKNILSFDRSFIGLFSFVNIKKTEIEYFIDLIHQTEEEETLSIPTLISKIELNKKFKNFVKHNNINKYFIASLVRYFFPEYKGGCNILTRKQMKK